MKELSRLSWFPSNSGKSLLNSFKAYNSLFRGAKNKQPLFYIEPPQENSLLWRGNELRLGLSRISGLKYQLSLSYMGRDGAELTQPLTPHEGVEVACSPKTPTPEGGESPHLSGGSVNLLSRRINIQNPNHGSFLALSCLDALSASRYIVTLLYLVSCLLVLDLYVFPNVLALLDFLPQPRP